MVVELLRSLDGTDAEDVRKTLRLSATFVFESVGDRPFESGLIHFLAAMGIDGETGRLRMADDYSYAHAGVVYCARVIGAEALLPSVRREEQGDAEREEFLRKRRDFLADGSYSPMSTMLYMLANGKRIATDGVASTAWSADSRTLLLNGKPVAISRFRTMVHDVIAEAEKVLWNGLMPMDRFAIELDEIADDVASTKPGVSFVSGSQNVRDGGLQLMLAVQGDSQTRFKGSLASAGGAEVRRTRGCVSRAAAFRRARDGRPSGTGRGHHRAAAPDRLPSGS
jgi:hypothetical protein